MGQAFDAARNDDTFYLPPEAFQTADFQRGIKLFLSPDGHAVRFTVFHQGDPLSEEGTSHIEPLRIAAADAIKGTPLEGSTVFVGGSAAMYKDMQQGADYDLLIAAVAALILIFLIMVVLTQGRRCRRGDRRHRGAESRCVLWPFGADVATPHRHPTALDGAADVGHRAARRRRRLQPAAGLPDEGGAPRRTAHGHHPVDGGTGSVVTAAGLVFAFTMMAMSVSELIVIGQVGTTIGLGLLFDTLVVRSLMTPSLAALLGRWFWWPQRVRQRPRPSPWPRTAAQSSVAQAR